MKKIYIIHGWTYTTSAWDAACNELRIQGFEPVLLKVPGLTAASEKSWTLAEYVEWLDAQLPYQKDLEKHLTLIGHSNGGRIALAFAARNPERISRLILIDSAGIVHNEWPLRLKRKILGSVAQAGKQFTSSSTLRKIFYKIIGAKDYERAPENMRITMKNMISADLTPELPEINIPTLIIWGKKDTATPVGDAYIMHEAIRNSQLLVIADAGHSPQLTHPERVVEEIKDWYEKLSK